MPDKTLAARLLNVMEQDILPMTERGVAAGNKVFGAAILCKSDLSLVIAETNNELENPLWHGEVHTLKRLYELGEKPATKDLIFLSTHEPCTCACRRSPGPGSTISTISSATRIRATPSPFLTT